MKYLYALLFTTIFPFFLYAQLPEGKLYTLIESNGGSFAYNFGYIDLPDKGFVLIDTVTFSDIEVYENRLFVTSGPTHIDDTPILIYDLNTDNRVDTITHISAKKLDFWGNKMVTLNSKKPFFSVLEADSPYSILYSLDTTIFVNRPTDLVITGNKAFVLYQSSMVIVDLVTEDTIETVAINPPLSGGVGFGKYITPLGGKIYIDIEYATGAIRSSMMAIDTATYMIDTTFHAEGFASVYQPIASQDRFYMYNYDSFFRPSDDSLHLIAGLTKTMIEHDIPSQTDFVSRAWSDSLFAYQNGSVIKTWLLGGYLRNALWVSNEVINDFDEKLKIGAKIYPNPFESSLNMTFDEPLLVSDIMVFDLEGRIVLKQSMDGWGSEFSIPTKGLSSGFYFLELRSDKGVLRKKVLKD